MELLIFLLQFFVGIGVWYAVPYLIMTIALWASRRWRVWVWQVGIAQCTALALLGVYTYVFLPSGGKFPLATAIIAGGTAMLAWTTLWEYQGYKIAKSTE